MSNIFCITLIESSFTFAYDRLNSKNAKDFLEKSVDVMPFEIKGV
jgi:hypothetical protein